MIKLTVATAERLLYDKEARELLPGMELIFFVWQSAVSQGKKAISRKCARHVLDNISQKQLSSLQSLWGDAVMIVNKRKFIDQKCDIHSLPQKLSQVDGKIVSLFRKGDSISILTS